MKERMLFRTIAVAISDDALSESARVAGRTGPGSAAATTVCVVP